MNGRLRQGRFELKYAVPVALRADLLAFARPHIEAGTNAVPLPGGGSGYRVHSLYFDAISAGCALRDYRERLCERSIRNRLRVRTYGLRGEKQPVFLENKRKEENRVVKSRTWICSASAWHSAVGPHPWQHFSDDIAPKNRFAYRDFDRLVAGQRSPVSVVHYLREVYVPRGAARSGIRLTLDREVRATTCPQTLDLYAPADVDLIPPDWMVLEMKFSDVRPAWMGRLVKTFRLQAVPVSKFGLSVALGFRSDRPAELRYFTPQPLRARGNIASRRPRPAQSVG